MNIPNMMTSVASDAFENSPNVVVNQKAPEINDENYIFDNGTLIIKDHVQTVTQFWSNDLRNKDYNTVFLPLINAYKNAHN